jgi:hypothetical protein
MITIVRPPHLPRFGDDAPEPVRPSQRAETMPTPGNVGYLFSLGRDEFFELHGIPWRIPPIPSLVGAALYKLKAQIHNAHAIEQLRPLTMEEHDEYAATLREVTALMSSCLYPIRKRDKLLRKVRRWRPLKRASDADLKLLLDFLLALRGKSTIRRYPQTLSN